eukprot:59714-Pyramimonas_sp.AAC.1
MMQSEECSIDAMQVAWRTQYFQIASAPAHTSWKLVKGPAGAFSRLVLHLGWKCSSCYSVLTRTGCARPSGYRSLRRPVARSAGLRGGWLGAAGAAARRYA